jgi:EAL domain-containing protein (putative c-di-GMP-specific phosphodiesterase class I)
MGAPGMTTIGISSPKLLSLLKQGERAGQSQLVGLLELPGELHLAQSDYENLIRGVSLCLSGTTRQFLLENGMLVFVGDAVSFGDVGKMLEAVRERLMLIAAGAATLDKISHRCWQEFRWPESRDSLCEILEVAFDDDNGFRRDVWGSMAGALRDAISREAVFDSIRRQAIIKHHRGYSEILGHELYCSLGYLRRNYLSDYPLSSAVEIEILMRALDDKVMDLVQEIAPRLLPDVLHLNMQVDTVLTARFIGFLSEIYNRCAENLVIEIALEDALRDWEKFRAGCSRLRRLGVRVGLDRISLTSLEVLSPCHIDVDFAKVIWDSNIVGSQRTDVLERLREFANSFASRGKPLILTRVNSQVALRLGRCFGVTAFQGCVVDASLGKFFLTKCTSRKTGCHAKRCAVCQWAPRETVRNGCRFYLRARDTLSYK